MVWVILVLTRMGRKVIQVRLDNVANIMKRIGHFPLIRGSNIFEVERELLVREHTPWVDKVVFSWLASAMLI